jgi:hypothetical protein
MYVRALDGLWRVSAAEDEAKWEVFWGHLAGRGVRVVVAFQWEGEPVIAWKINGLVGRFVSVEGVVSLMASGAFGLWQRIG